MSYLLQPLKTMTAATILGALLIGTSSMTYAQSNNPPTAPV